METKSKSKKIFVIVAIAAVLVAIVVAAVIFFLSGRKRTNSDLKLGDKYLSSLNYDEAIAAYSNVIMIDPTNEDALAGLMQCYAKKGDYDMAQSIYADGLTDSKNTRVLRTCAEIKEAMGDLSGAIRLVDELIEISDEDTDYEWYRKILVELLRRRYSYANKDSIQLSISNGSVKGRGNNVLGALGTDQNLGVNQTQPQTLSIAFPKTPYSVFTTGTTSAIVDDKGVLYLAGSNRSGQKANGTVEMIASGAWTEITEISNVAKVTGTQATLFALTGDGNLWVSGENRGYVTGSGVLSSWSKLTGFGTILNVVCDENIIYILTADGKLYQSQSNNYYSADYYVSNPNWKSIAKNVACFAVQEGRAVYYTTDGYLGSTSYYDSFNERWLVTDNYGYQKYKPDITIADMVLVGDRLFLLTSDNKLYGSRENMTTEISLEGVIDGIYKVEDGCVVVFNTGAYVVLDQSGSPKSVEL